MAIQTTNNTVSSILDSNLNVNAPVLAPISERAKDNILKVMTKLITRKGEGTNGWYSRMISTYDIRKFFSTIGYNISIQQIEDVVNALIEDKLVRYYLIPNTNYVSLGLTQLYYDLMDELCDDVCLIPEEFAEDASGMASAEVDEEVPLYASLGC